MRWGTDCSRSRDHTSRQRLSRRCRTDRRSRCPSCWCSRNPRRSRQLHESAWKVHRPFRPFRPCRPCRPCRHSASTDHHPYHRSRRSASTARRPSRRCRRSAQTVHHLCHPSRHSASTVRRLFHRSRRSASTVRRLCRLLASTVRLWASTVHHPCRQRHRWASTVRHPYRQRHRWASKAAPCSRPSVAPCCLPSPSYRQRRVQPKPSWPHSARRASPR